MQAKHKSVKIIELIIFNCKWLLVPFYIKLIYTLCRLLYYFVLTHHITNETIILTLEDVDIVMIANLVKMIITGSFSSFVNKNHGKEGETASSGMLKVKMATSLVGVTGIALLQKAIDVNTITWESLYKLGFVHVIFLISSIALMIVEFLHCKSETYLSNIHHQK